MLRRHGTDASCIRSVATELWNLKVLTATDMVFTQAASQVYSGIVKSVGNLEHSQLRNH